MHYQHASDDINSLTSRTLFKSIVYQAKGNDSRQRQPLARAPIFVDEGLGWIYYTKQATAINNETLTVHSNSKRLLVLQLLNECFSPGRAGLLRDVRHPLRTHRAIAHVEVQLGDRPRRRVSPVVLSSRAACAHAMATSRIREQRIRKNTAVIRRWYNLRSPCCRVLCNTSNDAAACFALKDMRVRVAVCWEPVYHQM